MNILSSSVQNKTTSDNINVKTLNADLKQKANFVIKNLLNFKSKKKKNQILVNNLINDVTKVYAGGTNESVIIEALHNAQYTIPEESRRLSTLLFTLRKQVENASLYSEMGVSLIYPEISFADKKDNNVKTDYEKLLMALMNCSDDKWTKNLSIVCVYGNINSHGNSYGHSLIRLGELGYLHIDSLLSRPTFIPHNEFGKYLIKNNSFVVDVQQLTTLLDANIVKETVADYAAHRWFWQITHHNCLTFARKIAYECGVSHAELGGGRGYIKTPIDFFMLLDKEKSMNIELSYEKPEPIKHELITKPMDNMKTLCGAAKQMGKNYFNPTYARLDILPLCNQGLFKSNKNNEVNVTSENKACKRI